MRPLFNKILAAEVLDCFESPPHSLSVFHLYNVQCCIPDSHLKKQKMANNEVTDCPWTLSSHWKSVVMVSSTLRVDLVMGCTVHMPREFKLRQLMNALVTDVDGRRALYTVTYVIAR